jgi:hypothetical protein
MVTHPSTPATLAAALGLRPLDRLQIADRSELAQMRRTGQPLAAPDDLPFWFIQRVMPCGQLEVATTSGYVTSVSVLDVCDIRREPAAIKVKAMPRSTFLRRLSARCGQPLSSPGPDDYADAYVLRVVLDRWQRVDSCYVQFVDDALNSGAATFSAPLAAGEAARLLSLARQGLFPVSRVSVRRAGFGGSARGLRREATQVDRQVRALFKAALEGDAKAVARLAAAGARP